MAVGIHLVEDENSKGKDIFVIKPEVLTKSLITSSIFSRLFFEFSTSFCTNHASICENLSDSTNTENQINTKE